MAVSVLVNNRLSVLRCWVRMRRRNDEVFLSKQVVCCPFSNDDKSLYISAPLLISTDMLEMCSTYFRPFYGTHLLIHLFKRRQIDRWDGAAREGVLL